jgi:hypothetical protein
MKLENSGYLLVTCYSWNISTSLQIIPVIRLSLCWNLRIDASGSNQVSQRSRWLLCALFVCGFGPDALWLCLTSYFTDCSPPFTCVPTCGLWSFNLDAYPCSAAYHKASADALCPGGGASFCTQATHSLAGLLPRLKRRKAKSDGIFNKPSPINSTVETRFSIKSEYLEVTARLRRPNAGKLSTIV